MLPAMDVPMVISRPHYISSDHCGYCHGRKRFPQALVSQRPEPKPKPETNSETNPETPGSKPEPEPASPSESITIGAQVEQMSCAQYDELINQGFRRSGKFLYKPDLLRNCCRLYTIRTDLDHLKVLKMHRKTVNRFIREISPTDKDTSKSKHDQEFRLTSLITAEQRSTRFRTKFEPSHFSREKFELYKKYQIHVHNDDEDELTVSSFKRFLCDTPFPDHEVSGKPQHWDHLNSWIGRWQPSPASPPPTNRRIGPTHECYYLDDKLIAISVLDFLPTGISSIYFIWDPDYAHLSLGTLSGLREIQMCHELGLGYYYLGYYIEDCDKMNYKSKFGGELLDLCNEVYLPLDSVKPFLKDGTLFVAGGHADVGDVHRELELENTGHPVPLAQSPLNDDLPLVDISEAIYGKSALNTYEEARTAYKVLTQRLKLTEPGSSTYKLPLVIPGVIPIWQMLEWVEDSVFDDDLPVTVFEMMAGQLRECTFGELSGGARKVVFDSIRLFGLDKVQEAIIIM